MSNECACDDCKQACQLKPGWLMPGEAERVAETLGVSLEELFVTHLMVDWWVGDESFILSPAIVDRGLPGDMFPSNPRGTCAFYQDGKCSIHEVKPFECREYHHSDDHDTVSARHRAVADAWRTPESLAQVTALLGREPHARRDSFFSWLLGDQDEDDYEDLVISMFTDDPLVE